MRYLVALDGSPESDEALESCVEIASALDAYVEALYVVQPELHDLGGDEPIGTALDAAEKLVLESVVDAEQRGLDVLDEAEERLKQAGVDGGSTLLYGDPATEIARHAEHEGFDGVYVGHQGMSRRMESYIGSVAGDVVRRASVPVTVVR
ncbi:MAG: universal stress protein [Halobacteriales archaeon]